MYIVFEGIDGAGKSTQINLLKDWLEQNGFDVETVVEPTDSEVGKLIRKILQRRQFFKSHRNYNVFKYRLKNWRNLCFKMGRHRFIKEGN